jgi:hypothetical protein
MKITVFRVILLLSLLAIGWIGGGMAQQQGNLNAMVSIGALFSMIAAVFVIYFIVSDYREREQRHEKDAEERLRKEIEKWK